MIIVWVQVIDEKVSILNAWLFLSKNKRFTIFLVGLVHREIGQQLNTYSSCTDSEI